MNRSKLYVTRNTVELNSEQFVNRSDSGQQQARQPERKKGKRLNFEKELLIKILKIWETLFYRDPGQHLYEHILNCTNSLFAARQSFLFLILNGRCHGFGLTAISNSVDFDTSVIYNAIIGRLSGSGQVEKILTKTLVDLKSLSSPLMWSTPQIYCCPFIFKNENIGILCLEHNDPDLLENKVMMTSIQFFAEQAAYLISQNSQIQDRGKHANHLSERSEQFLSSEKQSTIVSSQDFELREPTNSSSLNNIILDFLVSHADEFSQRNILVDYQLQEGLPEIYINKDHIQRMLLTLVKVAICSRDHARILIKTSHCQDTGRVRLSVSDDGPGIPKYRLKQIFNAFHQAGENKKLNICDAVIQRYGGTMAFKSLKGGGMQFIIAFPVLQEFETRTGLN